MKTISYITWGLIAFYTLFAIFVIIDLARNSSGMDAAGRGMSGGFTLVGVVALILLALLHLLPFKLTKIISFLLALAPLLSFISTFSHNLSYKLQKNAQKNERLIYFDAKPLQDMAIAIHRHYFESVEKTAPQIQSDINQPSKNELTLLHLAIEMSGSGYGDQLINGKIIKSPKALDITEILLKNGANPNVSYPVDAPILVYASDFGDTKLLGLLLQYGADPNAKDSNGVPILYKLMKRKPKQLEEKLSFLLENGANPNVDFGNVGWNGTLSLLMIAAEEQQWAVCKVLLENGANPDFQPSSSYAKTFGQWLEYHQTNYAEKGALPNDFKAFLEWLENRKK